MVVGSLAGEAASIKDYILRSGPWFWIGDQGWEYLDLGRLWQILLVVGMLLWVVILVRGLWSRLAGEHPGNLPYLFLYSALSIPVFYAAGLVFGKERNFAVMDFWRFWVVHLWVEDFLELFTTIMVAYIFVLLGVVQFDHGHAGGLPGHHPLLRRRRDRHDAPPLFQRRAGRPHGAGRVLLGDGGDPAGAADLRGVAIHAAGQAGKAEARCSSASSADFPHKWAVMFLIAVGFWNFLGAGVFGFLINLPIVSYYEIGTQFTANHAHGAMMGVYGMLAMGFFMFVARYFIPPDRNSERAMKISFWSLNIGLAVMLFVNLVPIGALQLYDSLSERLLAQPRAGLLPGSR